MPMNINDGPVDGAKVGWDFGWEVGVDRLGEGGGGKMDITVFELQ